MFKGRAGRRPTYDWDLLTSGSQFSLVRGRDFKGKPSVFRDYLYDVAERRGLRVGTEVHGDVVTFQFGPKDESEGAPE